jgi:hypothetical protein
MELERKNRISQMKSLWSIDFKEPAGQHTADKKKSSIFPKGYAPSSTSSKTAKKTVVSKKDKEENTALKLKKAWEAALV